MDGQDATRTSSNPSNKVDLCKILRYEIVSFFPSLVIIVKNSIQKFKLKSETIDSNFLDWPRLTLQRSVDFLLGRALGSHDVTWRLLRSRVYFASLWPYSEVVEMYSNSIVMICLIGVIKIIKINNHT